MNVSKRSTIYDIARLVNMPPSTVSRILRGTGGKESSIQAVKKAASELNYFPNQIASALKSKKTNVIGIMIPRLDYPFHAAIVHNLEKRLNAQGFKTLIFQHDNCVQSEINGIGIFMQRQVDGIIACMASETKDLSHFEQLIEMEKPLVLFDQINVPIKAQQVTLNDYETGFMATKHLLEKGYENIAFLNINNQSTESADRLLGYRDALTEQGKFFDPRKVLNVQLSVSGGRYGLAQLFSRNLGIDAIVAGSDFTALGVIKKLGDLGMSVDRFGVIGFSNELFTEYTTPSISTIDQQPEEFAQVCSRLLLEMIDSENPYKYISRVTISPALVARESTSYSILA